MRSLSEDDLFVVEGQELPLSGAAMLELLVAVLDRGVPFRFKAKGFSMSPFVKDGDVITVISLRNSLPRLGDVVAFRHPLSQRLVVHRVVKPGRAACLIRGDAVPEGDGLVPRSDILGRVTRVERWLKPYVSIGPRPEPLFTNR